MYKNIKNLVNNENLELELNNINKNRNLIWKKFYY